MTLSLLGAHILGYRPDNNDGGVAPYDTAREESDYQIDIDTVPEVTLDEKAQDLIDTGTLTVDNLAGRLVNDSLGDFSVGIGDRISVWIETDLPDDLKSGFQSGGTSNYPATYGAARYGQSRFGAYSESPADEPLHRWTGLVRTYSNEAQGGVNYNLTIEAGDYVYQKLANARHNNSYQGAPISGSSDAILNTALRQEFPEAIGRSGLGDVSFTTDIRWRHRTLLDLLSECLIRGDAVSRADDTRLLVNAGDTLEPKFTVTHESGDWFGDVSYQPKTDALCNRLVVIGGTQPEEDVDDTQTTHDTTTTVTDQTADMVAVPITPRRTTIDSVDIWTDPAVSDGVIQGSGVLVRVQTDSGGAPVDIGDKKSDLTSGQVESTELATGGWTSIELGDDPVAPNTTNWLIVQGTNSDGQVIGARTESSAPPTLARRVYYPFPVAVEPANYASQAEYGRWEDSVTDETLNTSVAARDFGEGRVAHRAWPGHEIQCRARRPRMHALRPTDVIRVDAPRLAPARAQGDYIVLKRSTTMSGPTLETGLTLRHLDTF